MARRRLALLFGLVAVCACLWSSAIVYTLVLHWDVLFPSGPPPRPPPSPPPVSPYVSVLLCAQGTGRKLSDQLASAVAAFGRATLFIGCADTTTADPASDRQDTRWRDIGLLFAQALDARRGRVANDHFLMLVVDTATGGLTIPPGGESTFIHDALDGVRAEGAQGAHVFGASFQDTGGNSRIRGGNTLLREVVPHGSGDDDDVWWTTGRPKSSSAYGDTLSDAFNNREWSAVYAGQRRYDGDKVTRRSASASRHRRRLLQPLPAPPTAPCFQLPRREWTLRIVEDKNAAGCDAVASSFLVGAGVVQRLRPAKLWPPTLLDLDTGLLHFWIELKRRFHGTAARVGRTFSFLRHACCGPRQSLFDGGRGDGDWFSPDEAHRHGHHHQPDHETPGAPTDSPRQVSAYNHLSRVHDLREIEAPDGTVLNIGCTANSQRCPLRFVERGLGLPPCCRRKLVELLRYVSTLLTEHRILHFLDYGTLLGAVRGKKLLKHEYDGDITVDGRQWNEVAKLRARVAADGHLLFEESPGYARVFFSAVNGICECGMCECDVVVEQVFVSSLRFHTHTLCVCVAVAATDALYIHTVQMSTCIRWGVAKRTTTCST